MTAREHLLAALSAAAPAVRAVPLDTDPTRYPLETVLEDLARSADVPSARFAERRLEYRSGSIELDGSRLPWGTLPLPLATGLIGVLTLRMLMARVPMARALMASRGRSLGRARMLVSAIVILTAMPAFARAQSIDSLHSLHSLRAATRIRLDVHTNDRTLLRRPKTQSLAGALVAVRGDTVWLSVQPTAAPLSVPRDAIHGLYVSRGVPNRFESAVRRAVIPALASAAFTAVSLNARRRDSDPSPGRGALSAAASTALLTGTLGFINPKERWQRLARPE